MSLGNLQIKATMKDHYTSIQMPNVSHTDNTKYWRRCGEKGAVIHCRQECKMMQPHWKTVGRFLNKSDIHLPCGPPLVLFRFAQRSWKLMSTQKPPQYMFTAAFLITAKSRKNQDVLKQVKGSTVVNPNNDMLFSARKDWTIKSWNHMMES